VLAGALVTLPARAAAAELPKFREQLAKDSRWGSGRLQAGQRPAPADGQLGGRDAVRRSASGTTASNRKILAIGNSNTYGEAATTASGGHCEKL
jgi:hypothetical protein